MKFALLAAGTAMLSLSAQATALSFYFTQGPSGYGSGDGNTRTFTSDGITVTATAFSLTGPGNTLQTSQLGEWAGWGLGVCNRNEGMNCASPDHQVSNENGADFVLFQFSSSIGPASITIQSYGGYDSDATFFAGNLSNGNLTGDTLASLNSLGLGGAMSSNGNASTSPRTINISSSGDNAIFFGARAGGGDTTPDYFKIAGISSSTNFSQSPTPEPATLGMMGASLIALGVFAKRFNK